MEEEIKSNGKKRRKKEKEKKGKKKKRKSISYRHPTWNLPFVS